MVENRESHEVGLDLEAGLQEGDSGAEARVMQRQVQGQAHQSIVQIPSRQNVQPPPSVALPEFGSSAAAVLKFGSKIGIWASGISVAGVIAIFTSLNNAETTSICDKVLLAVCLVSMLASFIFGGILLIFPLFHIHVFQPDDHQSTKKINTIIGIAIGSMASVVIFVAVLVLQRGFLVL